MCQERKRGRVHSLAFFPQGSYFMRDCDMLKQQSQASHKEVSA